MSETPRVEGTITLPDGSSVRFTVEDSHGYDLHDATDPSAYEKARPLAEAIAEAVEDFEEEGEQ